MVCARDAPCDPISQWIALIDQAEYLRSQVDARPGSTLPVRHAIEALHVHEHTMTNNERYIARQRLWRRDHTDPLPSPDDFDWWAACQCRTCTLAHFTAPRRIVWQEQLQAVTKHRR